MKTLLWDYKTKTLLDCQDMNLDINMNPQVAFGIHIHKSYSDFCQLEFKLDNSNLNWIQNWLTSNSSNVFNRDYKRDLHLNNDIVFTGCIPKYVQFNDTYIEIMITCDHYQSVPFRNILEVHRDVIIDEILYN